MTCNSKPVSYFENSVDPDQQQSEKPADQDPYDSSLLVNIGYWCLMKSDYMGSWSG